MRTCSFKSSEGFTWPWLGASGFIGGAAALCRRIGQFLAIQRGADASATRPGGSTHDVALVTIERQWSAIAHLLRTRLDEQQRAVELHTKAAQIVNALDYEMSRFMAEVGQHLAADRSCPAAVSSACASDYKRPFVADLAA